MKFKKIIINTKHQLFILILFAFALNVNTLFNEYAVDDVLLTQNKFVEKGINGIPEILTTDYLKGYKVQEFKLSQPRYRPFSLLVFAIEYQFFGANPIISHLINVLLFTLLIALLFKLLQEHLFKGQHKYMAFITCLIFAAHPIHTEVIANIKSRDELLTFLFLILSLSTFFNHHNKTTLPVLLTSLFFFFLALITRESAVTFIGVIPLMMYFFFGQTIKKSFHFSIPFLIIFACYLALRFYVVGYKSESITNILDAPFLFANTYQAIATKVFILIKYVSLLIFPYPLSFEYGYNQIPYITLLSYQFLLSLLALMGLIIWAICTFKQKSIFSFSILYFIITISIAANFFMDIGTPLSERLLFQPSLAFCIVTAVLIVKLRAKSEKIADASLLIILALFSYKTFSRNNEWKNNETLYLRDVNSSPNSLKTNMFALEIYETKGKAETNTELKTEYFNKAVFYGERAYTIYPENQILCMNFGEAYFGLSEYFKAADLWLAWYRLSPEDSQAKKAVEFISSVLYKQGNGLLERGEIDGAIKYYKKSLELNKQNTEAWYNLGGNYFLLNDTVNAMKAWEKVKQLDINHRFNREDFTK